MTLEPIDQQYILVGHIARAQGVDGTVLIIPEGYQPNLFENIDLVRLQNERKDLIPARIESVRVQEKEDRLSFFVKFDHIMDRNEANGIKNFPVFINRNEILKEPQKSSNDLISFAVVNTDDCKIGEVSKTINNTTQTVIMVQDGNGQLLIPLVDEYVVEMDKENKIIHCQNLDRLKDL